MLPCRAAFLLTDAALVRPLAFFVVASGFIEADACARCHRAQVIVCDQRPLRAVVLAFVSVLALLLGLALALSPRAPRSRVFSLVCFQCVAFATSALTTLVI